MTQDNKPAAEIGSDQGGYNEDSIQQLEGLEAVRKRPGMYIGDTSDGTGLHHMVFEVVDNAIDEALAGYCDDIVITIHTDNSISVTDNGRGIPTGIKFDDKHEPKRSAAEIVMCVLHAGGKFNQNSYKVSGGLHGVGVSCVNALSKWLRLTVRRDGKKHAMEFHRGHAVDRLIEVQNGVEVSPLKVIGETKNTRHRSAFHGRRGNLRHHRISLRHPRQAPARTVLPQQRRQDQADRPAHRQGRRLRLLRRRQGLRRVHQPQPRPCCTRTCSIPSGSRKVGDTGVTIDVEVAMQWNDSYAEQVLCFTNNIPQSDGGTHLTGLRAGDDPGHQQVHRRKRDRQEGQGGHRRRRHARRPRLRALGEDARSQVRLADQDEAGLLAKRGRRSRKSSPQKLAEFLLEKPDRRQDHHRQDRRSRPRPRSRAQGPRDDAAQGRARRHRPARQARRLPGERPGAVRDLHRRGRFRRRLRQAGPRPQVPGDPAPARQGAQRREGPLRQGAFPPSRSSPCSPRWAAASAPTTTTSTSCATTASSS